MEDPSPCALEQDAWEEAVNQADYWINQVVIRGDVLIACLERNAGTQGERASDPKLISKRADEAIRMRERVYSVKKSWSEKISHFYDRLTRAIKNLI